MKTPKIIQALEILRRDKEESKKVYCYNIIRTFNRIRLDVLVDKSIASKYKEILSECLGVPPRKTIRGCWDLPLHFVDRKYKDVVDFSFKFEDN